MTRLRAKPVSVKQSDASSLATGSNTAGTSDAVEFELASLNQDDQKVKNVLIEKEKALTLCQKTVADQPVKQPQKVQPEDIFSQQSVSEDASIQSLRAPIVALSEQRTSLMA